MALVDQLHFGINNLSLGAWDFLYCRDQTSHTSGPALTMVICGDQLVQSVGVVHDDTLSQSQMVLPSVGPPMPHITPRRRYGDPPTEGDWHKIKPIFTRLYGHEKKLLKDVRTELLQKHGFRASENMYKKRISSWGLDRKLKQHEVEHILGILAQRRAQRKEIIFILRGKRVDMQNVDRYVRRSGMSISQLETRYMTGQSKDCPDLQVLSPKAVQPCFAPSAVEDSLEHFLREAKDLQLGLLESGFCKETDFGIAFEQTEVSRNMAGLSDLVVGSRFDLTLIREFVLRLEFTVKTCNICILRQVLKVVAVIARHGYGEIAHSILGQLRDLVDVKLQAFPPQFRFLQKMAKLRPVQLLDACFALWSLNTRMHMELRPSDVKFYIIAKASELVMRQDFGLYIEPPVWHELLKQTLELYGPLHLYTFVLTLRTLRCDREALRKSSIQDYVAYLTTFKYLVCERCCCGLAFDGHRLSLYEAWYIANIYDLVRARRKAAWLFEKLLECRCHYNIQLQEESLILENLETCSDVVSLEKAERWRERICEIRDILTNEVETAAPDDNLVAACRGGNVTTS